MQLRQIAQLLDREGRLARVRVRVRARVRAWVRVGVRIRVGVRVRASVRVRVSCFLESCGAPHARPRP